MSRTKDYFIGLDTETANGQATEKGVDLRDSLVYDLGWQVIDRMGNVYEKRSFLVKEIFCDENAMMNSAYYAKKIPMYWEQVKSGERKIDTFYNIRKIFLQDAERYNVRAFFAHNARFDYNALNNTQRFLTSSKYRFFFPYGATIWDTMKMARDTIARQDKYKKFCVENNYMTKHKTPRPRITAEILYRFISGDNDFIEAHTGLEDVEIESKIFAYIFDKFHTKFARGLWEPSVYKKVPDKQQIMNAIKMGLSETNILEWLTGNGTFQYMGSDYEVKLTKKRAKKDDFCFVENM